MTGYEQAQLERSAILHPQSTMNSSVPCSALQKQAILCEYQIRWTTDDTVYFREHGYISWEWLTAAAWCNDDDNLSMHYQVILHAAMRTHHRQLCERYA